MVLNIKLPRLLDFKWDAFPGISRIRAFERQVGIEIVISAIDRNNLPYLNSYSSADLCFSFEDNGETKDFVIPLPPEITQTEFRKLFFAWNKEEISLLFIPYDKF